VVFPVTERKGWEMALFGNKKPKLPSYIGVGLDAQWPCVTGIGKDR
jgi:hypothetical protein